MNVPALRGVALAVAVVLSGVTAGVVVAGGDGATAPLDGSGPADPVGASAVRAPDGEHPPGPVGTSATPAPDGAGPAAPGDAVALRNGTTYFLGQTLFTNAFGSDEEVDLERADGSFVTDVPVSDNGTILLSTEDRISGRYVLTNDAGTAIRFQLVSQVYSVEPAETRVLNGGENSSVRLTVRSNRDGYVHAVTSPDLDPAQLRGVLGTGNLRDVDGDGATEVVIEGGTTVQRFSAEFQGYPPGEYTVEFRVPDTEVGASVTVEVGVYPPGEVDLAVTGDRLRVEQLPGQRVAGKTTLPPGTKLTVTVSNVGGQPFRRSDVVRVEEDGTFETRLDFSEIPQGQEFNVTVRQGTVLRASTRGVVMAPPAITASPWRAVEGTAVSVEEVSLPNGGFVAVLTNEGELLAVSDYLEPGIHEDVLVGLDDPLGPGETTLRVRIHRDTDRDGEFDYPSDASVDIPYTRVGTPVIKLLTVTVPTPTPTPTPTATPTPTPTPTASPTPTPTPTASPTPTPTPTAPGTTAPTGHEDAPGFGLRVVLLALAALAGAALLRRRSERG